MKGERWWASGILAAALVVALAPAAVSQTAVQPVVQLANSVFGFLPMGSDLSPGMDPTASREEYPGLGHKFELFGTAVDVQDPTEPPSPNPTNDVVMIDTSVGAGWALRKLGAGVSLPTLDNELNLKYYFVDRSCGGGSPRISLMIDVDGDRDVDANLHGYAGSLPSFAACPPQIWKFEDLTDDAPRWDITQVVNDPDGPLGPGQPLCVPTTCVPPAGSGFVITWDVMETFFMTYFPNHVIQAGKLVDDSGWFQPARGTAFYDLVTIDNRTLENRQDTVRNTNPN